MKIIAFILAGDYHQYCSFIVECGLDKRAFPYLNDTNWQGIHGAKLYRIGTWRENPNIKNHKINVDAIEAYLSIK